MHLTGSVMLGTPPGGIRLRRPLCPLYEAGVQFGKLLRTAGFRREPLIRTENRLEKGSFPCGVWQLGSKNACKSAASRHGKRVS